MKSLRSLVLVSALMFGSAAFADPVFIDFETLPDGAPTQWGDLIGDSYAPWGVIFDSIGVNDMPEFRDGYQADGMFAGTFHASYPPGANIIADLTVPVHTVSVDVTTAIPGTITMLAKDATGGVIGSAESDVGGFWETLSLATDTPIASLEWWPSEQNYIVGVDNLFCDIPEPTSFSLLVVAGLLVARRRKAT